MSQVLFYVTVANGDDGVRIGRALVDEHLAACADAVRSLGLLPSLRKMLASLKTSGILLARYCTMIIMVPTMAFLPLIMSAWPGTSGLQIGIVIAARTLMNAVLQVPFGMLADRCNKLGLLIAGCTCLAATIALIPWMDGFTPMLLLYLLLGAEEAAVWAVLGAYASIEAREHYGHGTMMGVFSFAMSIGVFSGAMLAGISMDAWGIQVAYTVAGLAVLTLSLLAAAMIRRHDRRAV